MAKRKEKTVISLFLSLSLYDKKHKKDVNLINGNHYREESNVSYLFTLIHRVFRQLLMHLHINCVILTLRDGEYINSPQN